MGIWQRIKTAVKNFFTGGSSRSSSSSRSSGASRSTPTVYQRGGSYYGGGANRSALYRSLRGKDDDEEKRRGYKSMAESLKTSKPNGESNATKVKLEVKDPKQTAAEESRERLQKRLNDLKKEREAFNKATNNKYNTKTGDEEHDRKAYALRVGGYGNASPEVQKHSVKYHPTITSGARGLASGATFGATELAISKLSKKDKERAEAEKYYQENKNKTAEALGEIAGSFASFGATAGATERAGAAVAKKVAPKATEKITAAATEKLAARVGKEKAAQIVKAVGTDVAQNLTTGALYDINKASTEHKVGSDDWWKELGKSAALNAAITGGVAGASVIRGGRQLAKRAAEEAAERGAREAAENLPMSAALPTKNPTANTVAEAVTANADEAVEATPKAVAPETSEPIVENVARNANNVNGERQLTFEDAFNEAREERLSGNAASEAPEAKAKPKTKSQVGKERAEENKFFNDIDKMRKQDKASDAEMRKQTGGEFGVRQGEHTAAKHAPREEAERIVKRQNEVYKTLEEGNVKDLFTDSNTPFSVFKTANKAELKKAAERATQRVSGDIRGASNRLFEKAERLAKELTDNSALASAEHVTLDDIADIVAIRNIADETQIALPAKYEEAFSRIVEWQRTEAAQMLKSVDLFLKENDQAYRRMFIARDTDKYLRKVLNANDATIADIKRSLEENHGEGYYDDMIEALSKFKGAENEAEFRKAYADFQAEIFMNTKPTVWDTVNLWRHAFMLSSPKTGANNIIGNLLQRVMYNISDAVNLVGESVARGIDENAKRTTAILKTNDQRRLARMFTSGKRGEHNLKNAKYISGFTDQNFADTINTAVDADVAEMMASSKYMGDIVKGLKYQPKTAAGKIKQGFVKGGNLGNKYVSLMLNEPDSWFVERNYRSALLKYLEANGVNSSEALVGNEKLLREARNFAKDVALENTYKKANNVVSFLEGIRRKGHTKGSNLGYKTGAIILDAELPYLKVPANLIINNFKYSPMGVFNTAMDAYKYIQTGDVDALNKATRDLSKSLTGTGLAALGYMMFCQDQADDDSWGFIGNAKDELKEYGVRNNSFKIGNRNFNISNMGIGSVQFLMGASLAEDLAEQGKTPPHQIAIDALSKTVDTVADMSLMENAVSLLDTFGNGGDYNATVSDRIGNAATEIAGDYAAQFVPNPLRGVAKGMTSADLDTGVKKGDTSKVQRILERNKNNFIQGVPVINEKALPHKVDTHGNLVNERATRGEKAEAILNNVLNPLSPTKVNIPEADREELSVTKEDGTGYKPKGFDPKREYKAKVGEGKGREEIELTGKEREQVARAAKYSGYDGATNLIKKGMFGDRLGDRAQEILKNIPDDEEAAREYIFSTPEWKNADNEQKKKWLDAWYGEGAPTKGVNRTRNAEAYINIAGNSEGDFRWQNDLTSTYQQKYNDAGLADAGIDKGTWVDILEACKDTNHKWNEETLKNQDTINSAYKTKQGILSVEGLTPEQRIAAYQVIRGKRNGFGWYDWDGVSGGYSGYRRGYRRGWRHYGHGSRRKVATINGKSMAAAAKSASGTKVKLEPPSTRTAKVEPPKMKKYEV